ncbi:hypothetical protein [Luteimonas sp. 3794]|uniref:hypothetical protein n=1 Tax=Luteimonas sp. 3794 TaxID=2817730 RepID=UPI002855C8DD|nr:hypothetical protein [Luteimonas sp. 3794]MDR6992894.1 hypothetical protein [Luteimonas sp. 3794]
MRTKCLLTLIAAFVCSAATLDGAAREVDTAVFVGERISIRPMPDPCRAAASRTGELTCITMDELFKARYRVVQNIVGAEEGATLEFDVADHYGFPPFGRFRYALLFVAMDDAPWLHKYQAIPMHLTADKQWASCGDIRFDPDGQPSADLKALRFPQPIAREAELSTHMRASYAAGELPHMRIARGQVWCSGGILIDDVYRTVRDGVMRAREVPLPEWPGVAARP